MEVSVCSSNGRPVHIGVTTILTFREVVRCVAARQQNAKRAKAPPVTGFLSPALHVWMQPLTRREQASHRLGEAAAIVRTALPAASSGETASGTTTVPIDFNKAVASSSLGLVARPEADSTELINPNPIFYLMNKKM
jgi:hypothetical protein